MYTLVFVLTIKYYGQCMDLSQESRTWAPSKFAICEDILCSQLIYLQTFELRSKVTKAVGIEYFKIL